MILGFIVVIAVILILVFTIGGNNSTGERSDDFDTINNNSEDSFDFLANELILSDNEDIDTGGDLLP